MKNILINAQHQTSENAYESDFQCKSLKLVVKMWVCCYSRSVKDLTLPGDFDLCHGSLK